MIINYDKCGVMDLHGNKDADLINHPKTGKFPLVQSYKYLGVELNQKLQPEKHMVNLEKKLIKYQKMAIITRM